LGEKTRKIRVKREMVKDEEIADIINNIKTGNF